MKTMIVKFILASAFFGFLACNNSERKTEETNATGTEPKKTEVSVGPNGAEVKTKNGTEVKVNGSGTSVENKNVTIKLNTKDSTKKKN